MDEQSLNRRQILGGLAVAAGAASALGGLGARTAAAAQAAAAAGSGTSQAPTITTFKDKVIYITGGSSGIGLGIARAAHEAGARVVLGNLDDKQWADALKNFPADDPRVMTVVHNVLEKDAWPRTADAIEKKFGPVDILVNNAGVGLQQSTVTGTLNDWEWGMGVNFWGPVYGANTFIPRMRARGTGAQIVTTTSTSGIVPNAGAGIYSVSKIAAVGLMEVLRAELTSTNIGTTCFVPGNTTSNLGESESKRPETLRNAPAAAAPARGAGAGGPPRGGAAAAAAPASPYWARPQDPLVVGRVVLDGILNNDLYIVLQPEWRPGAEARANALLESMVPPVPMPESMTTGAADRYLRTPIYAQEVAHRQATRKRTIQGI